MNSIKYEIIKFIEKEGEVSKSRIEDFLNTERGTLGEATGRRMRELIEEGVLVKVKRRFEDKDYYTYKVIEISTEDIVQSLKI